MLRTVLRPLRLPALLERLEDFAISRAVESSHSADHLGIPRNRSVAVTDRLLENLDWARSIAGRYMKETGLPWEDEIRADAIIGLWQACLSYDESRGDFRPYAGWRIRGAIIDGARRRDPLTRDARAHVQAGETEWVEVHSGNEARRFAPSFMHFEDSVSSGSDLDGGTLKLADVLPDETPPPVEQIISTEEARELHEALAHLSGRERTVLMGIFIEDKTARKIATELGLTEGRVSQLKSEALKKTRNYIEEKEAA